MPVIPALENRRQEDLDLKVTFEASLWCMILCLKKDTKKSKWRTQERTGGHGRKCVCGSAVQGKSQLRPHTVRADDEKRKRNMRKEKGTFLG